MSQIVRPPSAHILMPMTPARTASYGVSNPPPLQLWLHAVLMLFAELVSRAVSTLQMILVRHTRDWHTTPHENLPREKTGISQEGTTFFPPSVRSTGGVDAQRRRSPRLRGETACRAEAQRRWEEAATLSSSLPSFRAKAHRAVDPEPKSDTHQQHTKPLASGSRALILSVSKDARARNDVAWVFKNVRSHSLI